VGTQSFFLLVVCALLIAMTPETAQASKADNALRAKCAKQVGGYYIASRRTWRLYGAASSPQWQNFYNCLDSYTQKRR
jgi:hypothetical protein